MNPERTSPNHLEIKHLRLTFEKVKYTPGLEVDLANYALDSTAGFNRMYSPFASGETIKQLLEAFIDEVVPEKANETLFMRKGEVVSEWQTKEPNVVFGRVWGAECKETKTWYLRNIEKRPGILTKALQKLRKSP